MKFSLRLDDSLYERLRQAAKDNHRSINAEVVYRLLRSLDGYQR